MKKSIKQVDGKCRMPIRIPKSINVFDNLAQKEIPALVWEDTFCPNDVNGINGFCKLHSYKVLQPIPKDKEVVETENVKTKSGEIKSLTNKVTKSISYNDGEWLDPTEFTPDDIEDLFNAGKIAMQLEPTRYYMVTNLVTYDDQQLDSFMMNTSTDIIRTLSRQDYSPDTLQRMRNRATDADVIEVIDKKVIDLRAKLGLKTK